MKRFLFIITLLGIVMTLFAKQPAKKQNFDATKEAVSTLHQDVKDITSTVHEDVKSITTTLYGDGKDAITTLYPDIRSALVAIGKAIGVAAEHVYNVLVKKFVVDGIVQLLPFLLGIILIIISWVKFGRYFKYYHRPEWHILYPITLLTIGVIILFHVNYNVMIMGLVNPEYGALNYILEYSKQILQ